LNHSAIISSIGLLKGQTFKTRHFLLPQFTIAS